MNRLNEEGRQNIIRNNKNAMKGIYLTSLGISIFFLVQLFIVFNREIQVMQNPLGFITLMELVLVLLAIISCIVCYNSTKKEELFIISLMYVVFFIDIMFGNLDSFTYDEFTININNYINIFTSMLRISILLISVIPNNKVKELIINNKRKSVLIVIAICLFLEVFKQTGFLIPDFKTIEMFKMYNMGLIAVYTVISYIYIKKSLKYNEYIYSLISSSIFFLIIKAIHAILSVNNSQIDSKLVSISITYISFVVLIGGIVLELLLTIEKNKQLESQLDIFKEIVDESKHSCIVIYDSSYNVKYINNMYMKYFDIDKYQKLEDLKESFVAYKNKADKEKIEEIENHLLQIGYWKGTIEIPSTDTTYSCSIQKVYRDNITNMVVIFSDISEEIRIKKYLIEFEKMKNEEQVRREFFANISHELRTPLNIFYSTTQLLDMKSENKESDFRSVYKKYKNSLKINCQRMLRIINNIVDITKIDVGFMHVNFENLDIVRLVEDITMSVVNYAAIKNITVEFDTDVEEHIIKCDKNMLERIMLNLLSNSIKFIKDAGKIEVHVSIDDRWVYIRVKDNGVGIAIEEQSKIFDRFIRGDKSLTRLNEGSGIGLSLVKSAVELHNGEIYLDSDGETGTEFEILLPNEIICGQDIKNNYTVDIKNIELELADIYELHNIE